MGLIPSWVSWVSCHRAIVPSWIQNIFSWAFRGSEKFSHGYFVGMKLFLENIPWVQKLFSWVFNWSKIFYRVYFVGARSFFSGIFLGSKIFSRGYFVVPKFSKWFSINFSKTQKETYGSGILTKNFKEIAFTMDND